jgi:hypothetical protein
MTAYRVVMASRDDLGEVTITCKNVNCKAKVTLRPETSAIPEQCPCCNNAFDESLRTALSALGRFQGERFQIYS